eukprot:scaffold215278_cov30-Prasinocladus_malaysianus.AAC.1
MCGKKSGPYVSRAPNKLARLPVGARLLWLVVYDSCHAVRYSRQPPGTSRKRAKVNSYIEIIMFYVQGKY